MTTKKNLSLFASATATFRGWVNATNVSLILICALLLLTIVFLSLWLLQKAFFLGCFLIFLLVVTIIGIAVFMCSHISQGDSTESMSLKDGTGRELHISNPSKMLIQILADLYQQNFIKPDKLIPPEIDLRGDPAQFKNLTEDEKTKLVIGEIQEAATSQKQA